MKYNVTDIKLRKVADGKRNAGTLFVQATVVNPDDIFDEPGTMTTFNEQVVKAYAQYLIPAQPGPNDQFGRPTWLPSMLKDASKPIPEQLTVLTNAQFEEFAFPCGTCVQVDETGAPRRNSKGSLLTRNSIMVLTKKTVDNETGEKRYARGWDPVSVGTSIMNALYAPLSQFTEAEPAGISLPQDPDTPLINSQTAPNQTAAPVV